jgi:hypothetical protein
MYVAPGLLDQRLAFYTRGEDGANGFTRTTYTKAGTYWGRIDATANAFTVAGAPQGHIDSRTTLTATVADYVPVDPFGLVKEQGGTVLYFVRGVYEVRQMRCQQVALEAVDPTAYGEFVLYDPTDVTDGVHLIDPASAFSTAFDEAFD